MWKPIEVRTGIISSSIPLFFKFNYLYKFKATPVISQKRADRRRNTNTNNTNSTNSPSIAIPPILSPSTSTLYEPSIHLSNLLNISCNKTNLNDQQTQQQQQLVQNTTPLLSVKVTIPKVPKPQRTQIMFEHVLIGLKYN